MTWGPLALPVLELLARAHNLYGNGDLDVGFEETPQQLRQRAARIISVTSDDGMGPAAQVNLRTADGLHRSAIDEGELAAVLTAARIQHRLGRHGTRRILDDARSDSVPAVDTPLGRQEALRRMVARLQQQRQYLDQSQQYSVLLAQRLRRLAYLRRVRSTRGNRPSRGSYASPSAAVPLAAVHYEKSFAPGHIRQRIVAALNRMGITDPVARRNWLRGYETLIARESGGRPSAVASEPATLPGVMQPDGRGLGFARGIAQTLPATFAHHHQPGTSTNIYDPVANICASMNYVIHRYGVSFSGENLATVVQQADAHRPPKGY
jgi:hypothetical protein